RRAAEAVHKLAKPRIVVAGDRERCRLEQAKAGGGEVGVRKNFVWTAPNDPREHRFQQNRVHFPPRAADLSIQARGCKTAARGAIQRWAVRVTIASGSMSAPGRDGVEAVSPTSFLCAAVSPATVRSRLRRPSRV